MQMGPGEEKRCLLRVLGVCVRVCAPGALGVTWVEGGSVFSVTAV